jgi:hypothetical protein
MKIKRGLPEYFLLTLDSHRTEVCAIVQDVTSLGIFEIDQVGEIIDQRTEEVSVILKVLLQQFSPADIADGRDTQLTPFLRDELGPDFNREPRSVFAQRDMLVRFLELREMGLPDEFA